MRGRSVENANRSASKCLHFATGLPLIAARVAGVARDVSVRSPFLRSSAILPLSPGAPLSKRRLQRIALRREQLRAGFRDHHVVFEPHAEFAANVNARFVAE